MCIISKLFKKGATTHPANDQGYMDAMYGLVYSNPFHPQSIDFKQYENGWKEAQEVLSETQEAHSISNEYEYFS